MSPGLSPGRISLIEKRLKTLAHQRNIWKNAIIRVGDGRGFLVSTAPWPYYVITAAHCLPRLPPTTGCDPDIRTQTYFTLLGALDQPPTVAAQCLFADPISDVAVLGSPDGQSLPDEANAYEQFMDARPTLRVRLLDGESEALLLTREGRWKLCRVEAEMMPPEWAPTTVRLILAGEGYAPGCSGSPILTYTDGDAVGLISIGGGTIDKETGRRLPDIVGAPMLATRLPAWFVADIRAAEMF